MIHLGNFYGIEIVCSSASLSLLAGIFVGVVIIGIYEIFKKIKKNLKQL